MDWQWIAYNQPKKLFWTARNDQWGDLREKPDEFTSWEKHTHGALLIRGDGNICAVDSEHRATKTLHSLLCVLSTPRGQTRPAMINTSLAHTTGLSAVKSQSVVNSLDISPGELESEQAQTALVVKF